MFEKQIEVAINIIGTFFYRNNQNKEEVDSKLIAKRLVKIIRSVCDAEGDFRIDTMEIDTDNKKQETTPFNLVCQYLEDLYNKKNHDYGNSFDKQLDDDGLLVAKIRLSDKINRFSKLINCESQVKDEKLTDTMVDLACYSIMTLMWMQKHAID